MKLEEAAEWQAVKQASDMIDRMIPAGGMSAGKVLAGLGAMDLDADGSNAFGAMDLDADGSNAFGAMDLDADGSNAFGEVDLEMIGSSAFGYADLETSAFSGLGKLRFGGFAKRLKTRIQAKAKAAKTILRKVVGKKKKAVKKAANAVRKEALATNPIQKRAATQEKTMAVAEAENLTKIGEQLAKEAVDPKLTREEVKEAVMPEVVEMAKAAATGAKGVIQQIAVTKAIPSEEQAEAAVTQAVTGKAVPVKAPSGWKSFWSRLLGRSSITTTMMRSPKAATWREMPESFKIAMPGMPGAQAAPAQTGYGGKGAGRTAEDFLRRRRAAEAMRAESATAGFLSIGDIETVEQEPLADDLAQSWASDDVYGEPDIF